MVSVSGAEAISILPALSLASLSLLIPVPSAVPAETTTREDDEQKKKIPAVVADPKFLSFKSVFRMSFENHTSFP